MPEITEEQLDTILEQEENAKKLDAELKQERAELENVLKTDDGLKVLARIIFNKSFVNSNAFINDVSGMCFNLGRQSVGQELLEEIKRIDVKYVERLYRIEKGE